jgi:hypothetical protein
MDTKKSNDDKNANKTDDKHQEAHEKYQELYDRQRAGFDLIEKLEFIETLLDVREGSLLSASELKRRCDKVYREENGIILLENNVYRKSYKESLGEILDYLKAKYEFPFEHHPKRNMWQSFKNIN